MDKTDGLGPIDADRLALVYHKLYGDPCEYDGCAGGIVGREHARALADAYNRDLPTMADVVDAVDRGLFIRASTAGR